MSINLTDFEQTPIHRVFEMVKREAERYGVTIAGSEIVGLIPKRAIELTSDFYLQLENFSAAQVLENRMEAALDGARSEAPGRLAAMVLPFVEAVGQPTAAPGGGSVAALAGALGAALGQMVAGLSRKKKSQAAYIEPLSEAASEFQAAAKQLAESIDRDAGAFESVLAAYKLPQGTPEEQSRRDKAIEQALKGAAEAPLEVARKAAELFDRLGQLEPMASPSMLSDVQVGRLMAAAAVRGSVDNVIINVESLSDAAFAARMKSEAQALSARVLKDSASAARR